MEIYAVNVLCKDEAGEWIDTYGAYENIDEAIDKANCILHDKKQELEVDDCMPMYYECLNKDKLEVHVFNGMNSALVEVDTIELY